MDHCGCLCFAAVPTFGQASLQPKRLGLGAGGAWTSRLRCARVMRKGTLCVAETSICLYGAC